jgi:hypothetical protein
MVEAQDASRGNAKKEETVLAKIEPDQIEDTSADPKSPLVKDVQVDRKIELEKSLISATILLLREYGIRKSGAAVRDAVDISHQYVGPKEAVSSLSSLGFKASFGQLNIANLSEEFFPLIAFKKDGEAVVVFLLQLTAKYL